MKVMVGSIQKWEYGLVMVAGENDGNGEHEGHEVNTRGHEELFVTSSIAFATFVFAFRLERRAHRETEGLLRLAQCVWTGIRDQRLLVGEIAGRSRREHAASNQ